MFSPGNLRATFDNPNYEKLVNYWIGEKYTLRYTGGMVPDVFQIIVKEKGVFSNVSSPSSKAKLRVLFEVAPLGLLVRGNMCSSVGPPCTHSLRLKRRAVHRAPTASRLARLTSPSRRMTSARRSATAPRARSSGLRSLCMAPLSVLQMSRSLRRVGAW